MPSFGRLGKHSNRSQHGISDQQQQLQQQQLQQQQLQQQQQQHQLAGIQTSGATSGDAAAVGLADSGLDAQSALSPGSPHEPIDARQQQQLQQMQQHGGQSILQNPGPNKLQKQPPPLQQQQSSSLAQPQLQQQGQQAPAPPPHLYSVPSTGSATNNPSPLQQHPGNSDFVFDARQQQQQQQQHPPDFVDPTVNRAQSLRYPSQSSLQQQQIQQQQPHQQVYGLASSSVDDLPSPASLQQQQQQQQLQQQPPPQQPQPAPHSEKQRTNRKLHIIKGFFGSVRGTSDTSSSSQNSSHAQVPHPNNPPYDPSINANPGLVRRPSNKRVSTQPASPAPMPCCTAALQPATFPSPLPPSSVR